MFDIFSRCFEKDFTWTSSCDGQVLAFCREALEGQSNELFGEPVEEVGGFGSMSLDESELIHGLSLGTNVAKICKDGLKDFFFFELILFVFGKPLCFGMCWRIENLQILLERFWNYRIFQAMISWRLKPRACMECDEYKDSTSITKQKDVVKMSVLLKNTPQRLTWKLKHGYVPKKHHHLFQRGLIFRWTSHLNFKLQGFFQGSYAPPAPCFQASYSPLAGRFHIRQYHPGDGNSQPMEAHWKWRVVAMEGCCKS